MRTNKKFRLFRGMAFLLSLAAIPSMASANQTADTVEPGTVTAKIVGGSAAPQGKARWIASLQSGGHFCGGSLIADRWILTAGHCVVSEKASKIQVWVGGYDLRRPHEGETVKVKKIFLHPSYDDRTLRYDIALLELTAPVGTAISPAVLATAKVTQAAAKPDKLVTVSGWGTLSENGASPNILHEVKLPVVSNTECNSPSAYDGDVHTSQICAGLRQGGKDACQGDSGGPLWVRKKGKDHVVGIVSWGEGCAQPQKYGVYTRIASYQQWVESVTKNENGSSQGPGPAPGPSSGSSCQGICGGNAGGCWCDPQCAAAGDCCADYEQVCQAGTGSGAGSGAACESQVCSVDPFCCNFEWDGLCEDLAAEICG